MAGYLDRYGEGDERRERRRKRIILAAFVVVVLAVGLYVGFKNYRQKEQVKHFAELLQKQDYPGAYQLWGCTDSKPCRDYPFNKFLEDWGPKSRYTQISSFRITKDRKCGSGVIIFADFGNHREEKFWVEGPEMTLGYSPWPACPPR